MSALIVTPRAAGQASRPQWPAGMRLWWLAAGSLVFALVAASSRRLNQDSLYDLYAGRYVMGHGLPRTNVFTSVAHGAGWMDQQWLAQVAYYAAWKAGGYPALAVLSALLVTAGFAILALTMAARGAPAPRMFAWTLAALIACLGNTAVRAQSFAYLLLALTIWLLAADDQAPRIRPRTWLALPVLALWANTHGSVLLGVGITALYAAYRVAKALARRQPRTVIPYLALAPAALATITCTPYGPAIIAGYYTRFAGTSVAGHSAEWMPPSLGDSSSWPFFAVLVAVAAALVIAWRRGARPDPALAGLAGLLLALAATGIRFQAWFGFAGALLAADTLARAANGRAPAFGDGFTRAVASVLAAFALASLAALALTPTSTFESGIPARAINAAAAIAARNPHTRILADDLSGSPMLWLQPATIGRVGYDVRMEQYSAAEASAYSRFLFALGPRWARPADNYGIIVISPRQYPQLARALQRLRGWQAAYRDAEGLVLVRRDLHGGRA